jgi:drug/metabolite transporter (DMT)-like permease
VRLRVGTTELMVLTTVVLWSLNLTISRYLLEHGFEPLAYSTVRYGVGLGIFAALTLALERGLMLERRDWPLALVAAAAIFLNQITYVYALDRTNASTVGLILGATPVFAALAGLAVGVERMGVRFWGAALVSFAGVALVAIGAGGGVEADTIGLAMAVGTAATWAVYSVAIAPLMQRYSPYRLSTCILAVGWLGIVAAGADQTVHQDFELGWRVWALLACAVLGPLVLTNVLWFRALHRIGPSRAVLAANLQPFAAAVFALLLLDERMTAPQVGGAVLIAVGILLARSRRTPPVAPAD